MIELGVNIDHVATLRQQRRTVYPDPVEAAVRAEDAGADLITLHLREDRRHIQDADVRAIRGRLRTRMNLECAVTKEMLDIACAVGPDDVCLVPEKRAELTTEGGLDVLGGQAAVAAAVAQLQAAGIRVSLFIDPEPGQIDAAAQVGATVIELHTGAYAEAHAPEAAQTELERVRRRGPRPAVGAARQRRTRSALRQCDAGGGAARNLRIEHRPRHCCAGGVRRMGKSRARHESAYGPGAAAEPARRRMMPSRPRV